METELISEMIDDYFVNDLSIKYIYGIVTIYFQYYNILMKNMKQRIILKWINLLI